MEKIRLDKFIASQKNISRADAKKLIRSGSVSVNGSAVSKADLIVDTDECSISVAGERIDYKKHLYIMMNKPAGVISASEDAAERTVIDLLPEELKRPGLFPAGRLDKDTTGFMLITDDGQFAHDILSPRHHVPKNYEVYVKRELTAAEEERFRSGMTVGSVTFMEAGLEADGFCEELSCFRYSVTLKEGRYHQIKIMFAALDDKVVKLHRKSMGGLALDPSLLPGEARELTAEEISAIGKS